MAKTFYLGTNGATLVEAPQTAATRSSASGSGGTINERRYKTSPGTPGFAGPTPTGVWTVEINVTSGTSDIMLSVRLDRRDANGGLATTGPTSAEQAASAGLKTFTFTDPAIGTWIDTDEFAVTVRTRHTNAHGNSSIAWTEGSTDAEVVTQFSDAPPPAQVELAYVGGGYYG